MRAFACVSCLALGLGIFGAPAFAEQPTAKIDSAALASVKAKSLNRLSVGFYRSLHIDASKRAVVRNASVKSMARKNAGQKLDIDASALVNRKVTADVARSARNPNFAALRAINYSQTLAPVSIPEGAKLNKLR